MNSILTLIQQKLSVALSEEKRRIAASLILPEAAGILPAQKPKLKPLPPMPQIQPIKPLPPLKPIQPLAQKPMLPPPIQKPMMPQARPVQPLQKPMQPVQQPVPLQRPMQPKPIQPVQKPMMPQQPKPTGSVSQQNNPMALKIKQQKKMGQVQAQRQKVTALQSQVGAAKDATKVRPKLQLQRQKLGVAAQELHQTR